MVQIDDVKTSAKEALLYLGLEWRSDYNPSKLRGLGQSLDNSSCVGADRLPGFGVEELLSIKREHP